MKEILDKISSYNVFNFLFPGVILSVILNLVYKIKISHSDILIDVFIYYFVGMIVSRIGSIVIEGTFEKIKFINKSDYKKYVLAEKKDSKILIMLEVGNTYRTICGMFLMLVIIGLIIDIIKSSFGIERIVFYGVTLVLLMLFSFSYRKQVMYISKRIDANLGDEK